MNSIAHITTSYAAGLALRGTRKYTPEQLAYLRSKL